MQQAADAKDATRLRELLGQVSIDGLPHPPPVAAKVSKVLVRPLPGIKTAR